MNEELNPCPICKKADRIVRNGNGHPGCVRCKIDAETDDAWNALWNENVRLKMDTESAFLSGVIVAQTNAENNFSVQTGLNLKSPHDLLAEWNRGGKK